MIERTVSAGKAAAKNTSSGNIRLSDKRKKISASITPSNQDKRNAYRDSRKVSSTGGAVASAAAADSANKRAKLNRTEKPRKKTVWVRSGFDYPLFTIVLVLLAFGLIMMFSASYAVAYSTKGDSLYYLKKQALFAVVGLAAMIAAANFDYHIFSKKLVLYGLGGLSAP